LILAIQSAGGFGRRIGIQVRRQTGLEVHEFTATVEKPATDKSSASSSGNRTQNEFPRDLAAARAYRDKLRERWQQIQKLYEGGRFPLDELLRGSNQLAEAELAAAANRDERLTALRASVERLKQVKAIVDPKFDADVEPEFSKLAVDAEVLKAEAALDAFEGVKAESAGKR
jgi:hypothetical protein